ncbi:hypothetical protein [Blastococcus sp. VKM Ac-2987]|uniref:hypothetical protein n=1 Tax=Blastococcus sp. VKM Ac-2987 TaxID=3004141 RepID=UPI0022AB5579|nr:hypothetical protein [Blastococcus sp. VKM Ac-2987]MCZ2857301.1 hypothetical protein [Blastococcus sp. VKM Ac-2987]
MKAPLSRRVTAGPLGGLLLAAAAAGLAGCSADEEDPVAGTAVEVPDIRGPEDLEDSYTGALDAAFVEELDVWSNVEVTVLATVDEVLSPRTFTVTAPIGAEIEPVLVVVTDGAAPQEPQAGENWVLAATPIEDFDAGVVAETLGIDLADERYEEWEGDEFLVATALEEAE